MRLSNSGVRAQTKRALSAAAVAGVAGLALAPTVALADNAAADQATEVDVRFEAVGAETRVTVEHRGWDSIPQKHVARHGFELMLFQRRLGEYWRGLLKGMEAGL